MSGWTSHALSIHTSSMTMKDAAFLALIGMILLTAATVADLIVNVSGALRDVVPTLMLLRSMIYTFASATLSVFLYVFHKAQF